MRLTIINQFYTPDISPTAHLSASLAEHLASKGHDVTVITSRGGYSEDASSKEGAADRTSTVKVHRVWTPRLGKGKHWRRILDYLCFYMGAFLLAARLRRQDVIISLTTPPLIAWAAVVHRWLHRIASGEEGEDFWAVAVESQAALVRVSPDGTQSLVGSPRAEDLQRAIGKASADYARRVLEKHHRVATEWRPAVERGVLNLPDVAGGKPYHYLAGVFPVRIKSGAPLLLTYSAPVTLH